MTAKKTNLDGTPSGSLLDGAARFDAIAREVKADQVARLRPTTVLKATERMMMPSPDEAWSHKFMSQEIAPRAELAMPRHVPPMLSPLATHSFTLKLDQVVKPERPLQAARTASDLAGERLGGPLGSAVGRQKDAPRRSWLGRLFLGR